MGNLCGSILSPPDRIRTKAQFSHAAPLQVLDERPQPPAEEHLEVMQGLKVLHQELASHRELLERCLNRVDEYSSRVPTARRSIAEERLNTNRELWNIVAQPSLARSSSRSGPILKRRSSLVVSAELEDRVQKMQEVFKKIESN